MSKLGFTKVCQYTNTYLCVTYSKDSMVTVFNKEYVYFCNVLAPESAQFYAFALTISFGPHFKYHWCILVYVKLQHVSYCSLLCINYTGEGGGAGMCVRGARL